MNKVDFITVRLDVRSKYDGGKLDEDIEVGQVREGKTNDRTV